MADINVLDLTEVTPGSNDDLILFDRDTGEAKSSKFNDFKGAVKGSIDSQIQTLTSQVAKCETLVVSVPSFSALPQTITNSNIEDDMVVVNSVLSNPSTQMSDWAVSTSNGSLTISGTISGATTATLYLTKSR